MSLMATMIVIANIGLKNGFFANLEKRCFHEVKIFRWELLCYVLNLIFFSPL
jgi:hypothetical protein